MCIFDVKRILFNKKIPYPAPKNPHLSTYGSFAFLPPHLPPRHKPTSHSETSPQFSFS